MEQLLQQLAEPLGEVLLLLVNLALILGMKWLREHLKSEGAIKAVNHIHTVVQSSVISLNQSVVEALKNDGKFTENERNAVRAQAIAMVQGSLTPAVGTAAKYAVKDINALVERYIEEAVVRAKQPMVTKQ